MTSSAHTVHHRMAAPPSAVFGNLRGRFVLLFVPYIVAELLSGSPTASYLAAWVGSWAILFLSIGGVIVPLPPDRPLSQQLLRPLILTQVIFVGYSVLSSIFYFLDLNGYYYLVRDPYASATFYSLDLAATSQRYYVLGHAGLVAGMLAFMNYRDKASWTIRPHISIPHLLLCIALGSMVIAGASAVIPGLGQLGHRLSILSMVAAVLSIAVSLPMRQFGPIALSGAVFIVNVIQALLGGWKEDLIVVFLLLVIFVYPFYRKLVLVTAPVVLVFVLAFLPTYNMIFRNLSWVGGESPEAAARIAIDELRQGDVDIAAQNWSFLTGRLSEIGLFRSYLEYTPHERDGYYGFEIVSQALTSVIPRALWPDKPNLEPLAMERVYENQVVSRQSPVSAKPQYIVDGYLSWGAWGVLIACIIYGAVASIMSRLAERWFGGYLLGSGLMYTALFRDLWKGNCFEFLLNAILWSFVLMAALFFVARISGILVPSGGVRPFDRPRTMAVQNV